MVEVPNLQIEGIDMPLLREALEGAPCAAIRLNAGKRPGQDALYAGMESVSWCRDGYYLAERPVFTLNPLLHGGVFYVQDPSSMIYQQVAERLCSRLNTDALRVLDFCAAPGGKTTAIINALPDGAQLVANEYVAARGKILRENLEKWGYPGVITTGASADDYSRLGAAFDIVAVDAPCSGEGMMRKDEEARRQWSPQLVEECAALQQDILSKIAGCVKPGGYLIYSTCTFNRRENEDNSRYMEQQLGLEPVAIDSLNLTGIEGVSRALDKDVEALRFMPHISRGEGLYISILRRPEDSEVEAPLANEFPAKVRDKKGKKAGKGVTKKATVLSREQLKELDAMFRTEMDFEIKGEMVYALPATMTSLKERLGTAGIFVTGAGLPAAEMKGNILIPDSRVVLSLACDSEAFPRVELSEDDSLRYLRRESFPLTEGGEPKGYVAVTYKGFPLGLMKNLGNRANNLFPASWRIRMV